MTHPRSEKWQILLRTMVRRSEALALQVAGGRLPIPLAPIARHQRVKEVIFRRLLMDACTAVDEDGFTFFINCQTDEADRWKERWDSPDDGGVSLPSRIRFTIAHELAHTLLFDLKKSPPQSLLGTKHWKTQKSLEKSCQIAAGRILLPEPLLQVAARRLDLLAPNDLAALRKQAAISADALLMRLRESSVRAGQCGMIAYLRDQEGQWIVQDLIVDPFMRVMFPGVGPGHSVADFLPWNALPPPDGQESVVRIDVPVPGGTRKSVQECRVAWRKVSGTGKGLFLTVRPEGARRYSACP